MSISIAEKYPKLKFIVQDLEKQGESVISAADPRLKLNKVISPIGSHLSAIEVIFHSSSK